MFYGSFPRLEVDWQRRIRLPLEWLQDIRDYLAGRHDEVDAVLDWIEQQSDQIDDNKFGSNCPMVSNAPSLKEVSKQLWALLNPLVKDTPVAGTFANVTRHNGMEAWRKLAEPMNEDKQLLQKDLLPSVTNPKAAPSPDKIEEALEAWDTNIRLFVKAGGKEPDDGQKRITLMTMLPVGIGGYVTMHMELPDL